MGRYVIRRLLQMIPVFIGATLLIFLMVNVMGDPVAGLCGERQCDPATAAQLKREFGLDKPVWQQYLTYMGNVFTGDFGTAFNGQPVTELMSTAFPVTIRKISSVAPMNTGIIWSRRRTTYLPMRGQPTLISL